jgi:ABC-2 type transport system ATP-binding protein
MLLESVGKRYGLRQPWVVRDVSLDVPPGRLIRLEGPNGSGKSTLLRVAAGVTRPSAGRVTGRPHTGYVPEWFPGGLPFSGRDYLLHLARVHGLRGPAAARRVDEWLDRLGAAGFAAQPLRALSKGMCQKVAIAQALLARPGLLVLDEAWTGLEQAARGALDAAVDERLADGGAVMFVDHDQARLAARSTDRWQLGATGRVAAVPGGAPVTSMAPVAAGGVVVIELTGLERSSVASVRGMPGVLSCDDAGLGVVARVDGGASDSVLRQVLAWDGVHVTAVRAENPDAEAGRARRRHRARPRRRRLHAAHQRAGRTASPAGRGRPDRRYVPLSGSFRRRPADRGGVRARGGRGRRAVQPAAAAPSRRRRARHARRSHRGARRRRISGERRAAPRGQCPGVRPELARRRFAGRGRGPARRHLDGVHAGRHPPREKPQLGRAQSPPDAGACDKCSQPRVIRCLPDQHRDLCESRVMTPLSYSSEHPFGEGWATQESAASSERGRKPGAEVFECADSQCSLWHVRDQGSRRHRLLAIADRIVAGGWPVYDCGVCRVLGRECDVCAEEIADRDASCRILSAIEAAETDQEALAVLLDGIRRLASADSAEAVQEATA